MMMPWRWTQSVARALLSSRSPTRASIPASAGLTELSLETARGPIQASIWYPAEGAEEPIRYGRMFRGMAVRDGALQHSADPRPVALLSHGLNANRHDLAWLGERLCNQGYISVAIDHPGSTYADFDRAVAMRLWERARTLSQTLDALKAHATWGARINARQAVAIGHSAGGSTVLMLGGARIDAERFRRFFDGSHDKTMQVLCHDPRFCALLSLAPGTGIAFTPSGLRPATTPVLIISGTDDWQTPDRLCAGHYNQHLPNCIWERIVHAGHYTFKPPCQTYACVRAPRLCCDHPSVDRQVVHDQIAARAAQFFARHLDLADA